MKDKYGIEIEVGDTIVYAQRRGSRCWVDRVQVVDTSPASFTVEVTDKQYVYNQATNQYEDKPVTRKARYGDGTRAIVINKARP